MDLKLSIYRRTAAFFNSRFAVPLVLLTVVTVFMLIFFLEVSIIILFFITIIGFIFLTYLDKGTKIGELTITQNKFILDIDGIIEYKFDEISDLEILYIGYDGKVHAWDIIPRYNSYSGFDNYISFMVNSTRMKFRFYIKDKDEERKLMDTIKYLNFVDILKQENIVFNKHE